MELKRSTNFTILAEFKILVEFGTVENPGLGLEADPQVIYEFANNAPKDI